MNRILNKIKKFIVDETGGETVEWAGVISIIITIAVAAYNGALQTSIQSAIDSITNTIMSLAP